MAIIGSKYIDLIDKYKNENPDGTTADIIEMLMRLNPMLTDAYTVECNNGSKHLHTVRTGLPPVAWGMLYKGIAQGKSTRAQVEDTTGFVEGLSTIDERVLQLGNEGALRLSEATAYLEAMAQEVQSKIIYGNSLSSPAEFMGLAPRFNSTTAQNGNQIINAGGVGSDNTSIWFIGWGENTVHLLHPKGTQAGVTREDMGRQRVLDADGNPYYVKEEMFRHHVGLAVKDWRYVVRICNIDVSLAKDGTVDIYKQMVSAYYRLQSRRVPNGSLAIYMNRDMLEVIDNLATNRGSTDNYVRLSRKEVDGEEVTMFRGIPIRETDAILNTEALVS